MILNKKHQVYIYIFCISSLFISSIFGENSSGGSKLDYEITKQFIYNFSLGFNNGIEYFAKTGQIHSPVFYIFSSFIDKNFGQHFLKYSYPLISSFIPLIFYISLKKKFEKVDKNILFLMSIIIFFSPYFRSSAIWVTTDNLAILFFVLSVNSFLSLKKKNSTLNLLLCIFYMSIAVYIRQYYIIFFLYYFFKFLKIFEIKKILNLTLLLVIIFTPLVFYYYYFLRINSISQNLNSNLFGRDMINNILIFLSLYLFYTIPFYLGNLIEIKNQIIKNLKKILIIFLIFGLIYLYFSTSLNVLGGGVFMKLSYFLNIKIIFFISSFLGAILILINFNKNNLIIYLCIIFAFPTIITYQKYYDPLLILTIFTLTKDGVLNQIINFKKINLTYIYLYFLTFLISANLFYSSNL